MTRRPVLVTALATAATLLVYAVFVLGTGFAACGLFGCSGGKAAYAPTAAQLGLVLSGLTLVPLALVLARSQPPRLRWVWALCATALGAVVAMGVLGLGPHGCPASQSRAVTGPSAFQPGTPTCSGDRHAQ